MPELPDPKERPHPFKRAGAEAEGAPASRRSDFATEARVRYAELQVTSNFTFLTGASHPEEFVMRAAALGHMGAAITDCNTLAGVVRAHVAAEEAGIPLAVGCRVALAAPAPELPGLSVLAYATDRASYGRLCRLLTRGKRRVEKGQCHLELHDLFELSEGLLAVVVAPAGEAMTREAFVEVVRGMRDVFGPGDRLSLAASRLYTHDDALRLEQIAALCALSRVPMVATNDVHYHDPGRRALQDVLVCIREGCTIADAGRRLFPNAERCLKPPEEMARLFAGWPGAVERSAEILERAARFSLGELRYEYPEEAVPGGMTAMERLTDLARAGARERYPGPGGVPEKVGRQIEHELRLIGELGYAPYFLTVHDIVVFARARGILCQGRGAAANSAVCYCMGVTSVDPDRIDVLFERFVSKERDEPPDIDIDFEHERREEVIQHIYAKYGRERAALTAEVITYRGRSAVREVGKALGLSLDCVDRLSKSLDWWERAVAKPERIRELGLNPADPTIGALASLAGEILGFPRHLSQHVGGFVISRGPLCELVPIENARMDDRTVIEWDKDDIDALGMMKVDVLGLGMLTCIRRCFDLVAEAEREGLGGAGGAPARPGALALHSVPEEETVYDMICSADTIGVFQIESRAQMTMLPRLRPRCFYDLVIEVAIVRPGPIQGNMVHPYLRRRSGEEPVSYPDERVKKVLAKTLGVPLFQEQAMALAIVAAGFTPGEADQLRRAMAAWKRKGDAILRFGRKMIDGMTARGYEREFAERCFEQIKGFSEYGFPESHAASFALLVYVSAWLKRRHPAAFAAALLNSQPMGFYAPAQIVRDARDHGVEVRAVNVNESGWECSLERRGISTARGAGAPGEWGKSGPALRLGMRLVKGLAEVDARMIERAVREHGRFDSIEALHRASRARAGALRALARADAFRSMGLDRQQALWRVGLLRDDDLPLFDAPTIGREANERPAPLPPTTEFKRVVNDYAAVGLTLRRHPLSFLRESLEGRGVITNGSLRDEGRFPQGAGAAVAGLVLVRQRPSTAHGVVFITLEDETGIANLILRPKTYERFRHAARHAVVALARGRVERRGEVVHVQVLRIDDLGAELAAMRSQSRDFH